ncbi:hypothetical protein MUK42_22233 [Musa troglodytarum]|uniref:CCHC-type domain-containing protein n=1 Tax=Musa troglodytarum TaxID=320322 RepID=A0A9E7ESC9_9LILI|nr:hypothetical protein MUK42_22233 [Musa troglodytarum]
MVFTLHVEGVFHVNLGVLFDRELDSAACSYGLLEAYTKALISENRGRSRSKDRSSSRIGRSKSRSRKDIVCYNCGEKGHYKNQCKQPKKSKKKGKEVESTESKENTTTTVQDLEWIIDTGASYHATPRREFFTTYRSENFVVKMGNHSTVDIISMGDIHIKTNLGCKLVLKDVRHVVDLRLNLISVGRLDDEDYDSRSHDIQHEMTIPGTPQHNAKLPKRLWDPEKQKVFRSRDVVFFEDQTLEDLKKKAPAKTSAEGLADCDPVVPPVLLAGLEGEQLDVKTTFLHVDLEEKFIWSNGRFQSQRSLQVVLEQSVSDEEKEKMQKGELCHGNPDYKGVLLSPEAEYILCYRAAKQAEEELPSNSSNDKSRSKKTSEQKTKDGREKNTCGACGRS